MKALEVEALQTFYGKSHILHGISLEVGEAETVTLLGRNGAGKTTTLRSIVGLTPARTGRVCLFGQTTTDWPSYRIAALGRLHPGRPADLCQSHSRGESSGSA